MARSKPRAVVQQAPSVATSVVNTPDQQACVVAPCYQIVEPLADGVLQSEAAVVTAAQVLSTGDLADTLAVAGKKLKISINGAPGVVVNLPPSVGADIPLAAVVNAINSVDGITAALVGGRLRISTVAAGQSSSIELVAVADDAYTELNLGTLVGTRHTGVTYYSGMDVTVPFSSLPSPKADIEDVDVDEDSLQLYITSGDAVRQLSRDSAVGMNSFVGNPSSNAGVARTRELASAFGAQRTYGFAIRQDGGNTNKVLHLGRESSVVIPLGEDFLGAASTVWPDTSKVNKMTVTAIGLQRWRESSDGQFGNFPGTLGNAISVVIEAGGAAGEVTASWDGVNTLTITKGAGATFDTLSTALQSITNLDPDRDVEVTLEYAADHGSVEFIEPAALPVTFFLAGGEDPVDFLTASAVDYAQITGAVNIENGDTAAALGVDGETLDVSVDGGAWQQFTLTGVLVDGGGTGVLQQGTGFTAQVAAVTPTHSAPDGDGTPSAVNVLSLRTTSTDYTDSTLVVRGSATVLSALFSGVARADGELIAAPSVVGLTATISQALGDYNARAAVPMQVGLEHGSVELLLNQVMLHGAIIAKPQNDGAAFAGGNVNLVLSHSGFAAGANQTVTLAIPGGAVTAAVVHAAWNAAAPAINTHIELDVVTIGSTDYLVFYDKDGTDGNVIRFDETSTADFKTFLGVELFEADATTLLNSIVVRDTAASYGLQVTAVGNGLSNVVKVSDLSLSSSALAALLLGTSSVDYQSGEVSLSLREDSDDAGVPTGASWDGTSTIEISYTRAWPCITGPVSPAVGNVLFTGGHKAALTGDMLSADGAPVGRVVGFEDFTVGSTVYPNSVLVLQNYALRNAATVPNWYLLHYQLGDVTLNRISPEVSVSTALQQVSVKQGVQIDDAGFAVVGVQVPLHVEYRGLRKDVARSILAFSDVSQMEDSVGPVTPDNPLAFGLLYTMINSPGSVVRGIGVDEVTADAPFGTLEGYARVFEVLARTSEPYFIVVGGSRSIVELAAAHATAQADLGSDHYRVVLGHLPRPTEKEPAVVLSGEADLVDVGGGKFELTFSGLGVNVASAINGTEDANGNVISAGVGTVFTPQQGVFIDRGGDPYRYLVTKVVSTTTVEIDTNDVYIPASGPGTGGNDDGYFQTDAAQLANFEADGEPCSIGVRQAALSTDTVSGREQVCAALNTIAGGFNNEHLCLVQPDQVVVEYLGTEYVVSGFYAACAFAGMASTQAPQRPLNKIGLVGIVRTVGSWDLFSEPEMAIAAENGVLWLIQDNQSSAVFCRHQLTTNNDDAYTLELSAVRAIDLFSSIVWRSIDPDAGTQNLDDESLDALQLKLQSLAARYSGASSSKLLNRVRFGDIVVVEDGTRTGVEVDVEAKAHRVANELTFTINRV